MIEIDLKKLNLKYKGLCTVGEDGIPKPATYVGYNINNSNHVFLTRSIHNKKRIIALTSPKLESGLILNYAELTKSELEFSTKILEDLGI